MSMAMKYHMQKKNRTGACEPHGAYGCRMCHGGMMAEGGEVDDSHDMVGRIMAQRMSKGAEANDTPPIVDAMPADYDDLALRDDMDFHETGANSGDEIGDAKEDEEDEDTVKRIMKSRAKKDRNPRPA